MSDLNVLQKNFVIPVERTDLTLFDDNFFNLKERFTAEMKRMEQEVTRFSDNLMCLYGHTTSAHSAVSSAQRDRTNSAPATLENINNSPLIEGEGEAKTLKLQFDLSQFDPSEVKVKIVEDFLIVSATHEEKSDNSTIYREYHKEFLMPKGVNPQDVISSLSKDGVLTVQTPLPKEALTLVNTRNPSK
ncbi:heat shock protein beta-1-like [Amyelois transitella]|uniref:heat shock protein beta-1-like n=1 Tax=Amyelois transitella TaxID=680683 RepID=UPI00298F861B|nr:heat shock protein beta-1-like [Amyelois transitella]